MIRRVSFPAWLALPLGALLAVGCSSPRERLSDAMKLADGGQFDDAITALEEVRREWPDRPEASAARDAVEEVRERAALARYQGGDYGGVVRALEQLPGGAKARLFEKQPGMRWVPKLYGPDLDEDTLLQVLAAPEAPDGLKKVAGESLCRKAPDHAPTCRGENLDPAKLDIAAAIGTLERVESACRILEGMRGRCQGETGTLVFQALDAKFGATLRTRIAELEKRLGTSRLAADE